MRRILLTAVLAAAVWTPSLGSQVPAEEFAERRSVHAADARAEATCPRDVEWPELPATGRRIVHCCAVPVGQPAPTPEQLAEWRKPRTDVEVPQYAYYYFKLPGEAAQCLPVIIVQAERSMLGWVAVYDRPPAAGGAIEELFDLLGTEPPSAAIAE